MKSMTGDAGRNTSSDDAPETGWDEASDACLVRASQGGSDSAFAELVRRYQRRAYRIARAIVTEPAGAEDVVQDAFVRLHRYLHKVDPERPFRIWLGRVVGNVARDALRRQRVRATESLMDVAQSLAIPTGADPAEMAELRGALALAIARLPVSWRTAFVLYDVHGLTHTEISTIVDRPVGTVRSDVCHARRRLRGALAHVYQDMCSGG